MTWALFKDYLKLVLICVVVVLVIALLAYNEMLMWEECRAEHPFWFCWRILD